MLKMKLPGRRERGRPQRRFIDVVKEDMKMAGCNRRGKGHGQMETDDLLWQPRKGAAKRRR